MGAHGRWTRWGGRQPERKGLDLALLLDTTGSMGTHLGEVRRQLVEVMRELQDGVPGLRCGAVAFKDHGSDEAYLTRVHPLSERLDRLMGFLRSPRLAVGRGGGGAEAVECALHQANALDWRPGVRRAVLLIGDRPPHGAGLDGFAGCPHGVDYRDEVEALAAKGVAIYSVRVGECLEAQRVFEYFAARTGGVCLERPHVRELPSAIASVGHRLGGDLRAYRRRLEQAGSLTAGRRTMLHALAG